MWRTSTGQWLAEEVHPLCIDCCSQHLGSEWPQGVLSWDRSQVGGRTWVRGRTQGPLGPNRDRTMSKARREAPTACKCRLWDTASGVIITLWASANSSAACTRVMSCFDKELAANGCQNHMRCRARTRTQTHTPQSEGEGYRRPFYVPREIDT